MPAALVTEFINAIENDQLDHAVSLLSEHCEYDNVPIGKVVGRDKVRDTLGPFLAGYDRVEWVVYQDEGHGWTQPETRYDFWKRVERFLDKHIGAGAAR